MDKELENLTDYQIGRIGELLNLLRAGESICFDRRNDDRLANLFVGISKKEYYYVAWERDGSDKEIKTAYVYRSQKKL